MLKFIISLFENPCSFGDWTWFISTFPRTKTLLEKIGSGSERSTQGNVCWRYRSGISQCIQGFGFLIHESLSETNLQVIGNIIKYLVRKPFLEKFDGFGGLIIFLFWSLHSRKKCLEMGHHLWLGQSSYDRHGGYVLLVKVMLVTSL